MLSGNKDLQEYIIKPPFVYRSLRDILQRDLDDIVKEIVIRIMSNGSYNKPSAQVIFALKELTLLLRFVMNQQYDKILEEEEKFWKDNFSHLFREPIREDSTPSREFLKLGMTSNIETMMENKSNNALDVQSDSDLEAIVDEGQLENISGY